MKNLKITILLILIVLITIVNLIWLIGIQKKVDNLSHLEHITLLSKPGSLTQQYYMDGLFIDDLGTRSITIIDPKKEKQITLTIDDF